MLLYPVPVPSTQFTWIEPKRMFVTEISSIGGRFGRVYDDACDLGLTLLSRYPGRPLVVFVVAHTESREGDVLHWDLKPATAAVDFTLRVIND